MDAIRALADTSRPAHNGPAIPSNEDGLAQAFAEQFADTLRYCHHTGSWFVWTGARWQKEETKLAFHFARQVCRRNNLKESWGVSSAKTAAAVERFAQADRAFAVTSELWDADPWLLGTPGGTVDLRTGELLPARQEDYITKLTSVAPAPVGTPHPTWSRFLAEATKEDEGLQRFMQQIAGYCLTGDTREHALFFVYGGGGNGKGVFLGAVVNILADYARTAAMDTFAATRSDKHPTDLAMLRGARLVSVSETEEGQAWAEARIKRLTGGDVITARFMRQDFFEYLPTFKLLVIGNHKPILRNVDEAARRRFNIIPFVHEPPEKDPQLPEKLRAEYPAILRWMIDGCLDWQANGLVRPEVVVEATAEYFAAQDLFTHWIEDCCEQGPSKSDTHAALFASWKKYAEAAGQHPGASAGLTDNLVRRGFAKVKNTPLHHGNRGFIGLAIPRTAPAEDQGRYPDR